MPCAAGTPTPLNLVFALALSGSASETASLLAEHESSASTNPMWTVDLLQARAWTAAARGDLPEARNLLDQAATVGESAPESRLDKRSDHRERAMLCAADHRGAAPRE